MSEFWLCFNCCIAEQPQPVNSIQSQMQSKGGYSGSLSGNVQLQLVDTKAG
ncbi:hypothetical protein FKM82_000711 [Ascaphus truei]